MKYEIVQQPQNFPHAFDTALNAGDLDRLTALYHPQATIRASDSRIESGLEAVRAEMGRLISAKACIDNRLRHTLQHDDTALIIVDWTLSLTLPDGQSPIMTGTASNVLRHDTEHGWRLVIANPQGVA